jgi:hypothetical protein
VNEHEYAKGGPLPADMPRMRFVRAGVDLDGMCIYEWVADEDDTDE